MSGGLSQHRDEVSDMMSGGLGRRRDKESDMIIWMVKSA